MILIRHYHYTSISERREIAWVLIVGPHRQPDNLHEVLYLLIIEEYVIARLPNIEQLSFERKHPVVVPANYLYATHRQSLGRISLCKDQSTLARVTGTCHVGVLELGDSEESLLFFALLPQFLFEVQGFFGLG